MFVKGFKDSVRGGEGGVDKKNGRDNIFFLVFIYIIYVLIVIVFSLV